MIDNNKVLKHVCFLERYVSRLYNEDEVYFNVNYKKQLINMITEQYDDFFTGKYYKKSFYNTVKHENDNQIIKKMFFENLGFKFLLENGNSVYFFKEDEISDD